MTTWEEIRDEVAGMLADGKPLEDVIAKLDEMNKPKPMTNEDWFCSLNTEQKAEWLTNSGFLTCTLRDCEDCKYYDKNNDDCIDGYEATHDKQMWVEWLKQPHGGE